MQNQQSKKTPASSSHSPYNITVAKYNKGRYWGVWLGRELVVVAVYKKGAIAIRERLVNGSL